MSGWDQFDSLFASCARPFTVYAGATAIFACCFIHYTALEALPLAGALAGGAAVLRTIDKKTQAATPGATASGVSGGPKSG